MKIFLAIKQLEFAAKLFATAGFTGFAAALEAKNENALKDFVNQAKTVEKVVEKVLEPTEEQMVVLVNAELRELITEAGFTLAADADPIAALKAGLAAHKTAATQLATLPALQAQLGAIRAAKIEFAADATPAAVAAAIEARVSMRAGEELAKHGLKEFPKQHVETDPTKPGNGNTNLTGLARTQAQFEAKNAGRN